jgi:tRNA(Ile)-lysidine synthase
MNLPSCARLPGRFGPHACVHGPMYYGRVRTLAQNVVEYIEKYRLLKAGDRVGVAVSGGLDSVALLRLLLALRRDAGIVLSVVHFNHKLRGADSEADEQFVAELAQRHKLQLHCESGDVAGCAAKKHLSLETAARQMRYDYFRRLLREYRLNRIATAHTLDDQAETVLLRMVRGAGSRGLAGIYPQLSVLGARLSERTQHSALSNQSQPASIIRPLLGTRRRDLDAYLAELRQGWREDKSNRDLRHARNRVRHGILPRLERNLNPAVREALAETAEIARAEEEYWAREVARVLPRVWTGTATKGALRLSELSELPLALQRRAVRAASESLGFQLEFRHVEEILGGSVKAALPHGWVVSRGKGELRFEREVAPKESNYEYRLPVPGAIQVAETGSRFEAAVLAQEAAKEYNPDHLFDPSLLSAELIVRNWRAGDHYWPAHTKAPKKIKELLQERQVTGPERKLWPVMVSGVELVWVRGFPSPARLQPRGDASQVVAVREVPAELWGGGADSSPSEADSE